MHPSGTAEGRPKIRSISTSLYSIVYTAPPGRSRARSFSGGRAERARRSMARRRLPGACPTMRPRSRSQDPREGRWLDRAARLAEAGHVTARFLVLPHGCL